jgi:hypothetical protein
MTTNPEECDKGKNIRKSYDLTICDIDTCPYNNLTKQSYSGEPYQICLSNGFKHKKNLAERVKDSKMAYS